MRHGYFSRSWNIFKTSWSVLRQDRELLWLAVMNLLVGLGILLLAGLVFLVAGLLSTVSSADSSWWESPPTAVFVLVGIVGLVALAISNSFFHGAIVHGSLERISGGDPTVQSALAGARSRLRQLVLWGITALCISWLIAILERLLERIRFVGWILGSLLNLAWGVLRFLVMPIVIVEGLGPFASLKRSRELLRGTWGENLIGQFGLGIIGFLMMLPGIIVLAILVAPGILVLSVVGIVLGIIWITGVGLFISALNSVYQSVLYHYAVRGEVPSGYTGMDVGSAFAPKKSGGGFGGFGSSGSTTGF